MHPSFHLIPVLLGLSGGHRNSPWLLAQNASHCGAQTADGRLPPPTLRCSARQMGTPNTNWAQPFLVVIGKA